MKYFLTISLVIFVLLLNAQEKYSRAKVYFEGAEPGAMSELGIDIHEGTYKKGVFFESDLSDKEISRLRNAGYKVEISIEDVSKFYSERAKLSGNRKIQRNDYDQWTVPENWEYGSMGGYYTLDEVMAELDAMHELFPNLISERAPISTDTLTLEGRMMYWLKISDNPNNDEDEPEILYTSIHHAREAISAQSVIFYMWYLLENYDSDSVVKYIVDHNELYFVPIINPDGYQYNCDNTPDGGGMWRKNRRDNGDGSFGVDPNRNYGHMWGLDDEGSSPYTGDATYRGIAPFSETETKNMRDFCNIHDFQIALNYHCHGNLLLAPWGFTEELPEDIDQLLDYGELMTKENKYTYGPGSTTIYPSNGGSDDWMYGEQFSKNKILSYTPEIGGSSDGFWPDLPRIIPLCQEQMWQNITAARFLSEYAVAKDLSPTISDKISRQALFTIKRFGLVDAEEFSVSIQPLDEHIVEVGDPIVFTDMELLEVRSDSIYYLLDAGIENGTEFKYLLSVNNDGLIDSDTITRIYGSEVVIFYDDCEAINNWSSNLWNITDEDFVSPANSITDSPGGNYEDGVTSYIELDTIIDLSNVKMAFLKFWTKWEIEEGYDYVQMLIKATDGDTWIPMDGKYTNPGTNYQYEGKPVYDGFSEWVFEEVNLNEYLGDKVKFRFFFRSDNYVNEDGFYFDDFTVSVISQVTAVKNINEQSIFVSDAFPNPANDKIKVQYSIEQNNNATFELYNAVGSKLKTFQLSDKNGVLTIPVSQLKSGVYYYRLVNGKQFSKTSKFVKY